MTCMGLKQFEVTVLCLSAFALCLVFNLPQYSISSTMRRLVHQQSINANDPFVIETTHLPEDARFNPTIANGYLGHVLYSDTIYKNGLYNGEKGDSHRARIPGVLPYVDIENTKFETDKSTGLKLGYSTKYVLDMRSGIYSQIFDVENMDTGEALCTISQEFYAHRLLTRVIVTRVSVSFKADGLIRISLRSSAGQPSTDITFGKLFNAESRDTIALCGHTLIPEQPKSKVLPICTIATSFPKELSIAASVGKNFRYVYLASIADGIEEVQTFYQKAVEMEKKGILQFTHSQEWQKTWHQGSITVKSKTSFFSSSFISGLYYMLSAFPSPSFEVYPYHFCGVSPGGLTNGGKNQDYWGHVFWDQDYWMLLALLPIFPNAVRHGLRYRIARLGAAKAKAAGFGFCGAMYPWESAYTGADVCPGKKYRLYEQHVTADMVHILKQYVYATGDWKFLMEKIEAFPFVEGETSYHTAWDLTQETAKFWCSRVVWDTGKNSYVILNVMGPDEYYSPINNSAFTNIAAMQNLKFALEAADVLNITLPKKDEIKNVAENVFFPYDEELNFHPEFEGFNPKMGIVKQADTIMLGFPLMAEISSSSRRQDLTIYGNITDPNGPAMTWGMFAINWNDVDNFPTADEYFLRQLGNIQAPFQIWAEQPGGKGAVNFLTGIGGYIQSILYGYLRLRIHKNHMTLSPRLLPVVKSGMLNMKISGLKYHHAIMDVLVGFEMYSVTLAGFLTSSHVSVAIHAMNKDYLLTEIGAHVSIPVNSLCRVSVIKSDQVR